MDQTSFAREQWLWTKRLRSGRASSGSSGSLSTKFFFWTTSRARGVKNKAHGLTQAVGRKSSMSAASAAEADTPSAIPSISRLNRRAACARARGLAPIRIGPIGLLAFGRLCRRRAEARPGRVRSTAKRAMERAVGRSGLLGACGLPVCCAWWQGDVDRCGQDQARGPRRHDA